MYPVLFKIGSIPVETYYLFWVAALSLAMSWSVRRFPLYDVDDDEGRRVIGWAFLGMIVGARAFEYVWNFGVYWRDPSLILDLNRGGLSEVGAFSGAFLVAFFLCMRNPKLSLARLCDVVSPPAVLTMAVGRWGCFFAGCCVGVESTASVALHFPYDAPGILRHSTQIYYSFFAAAILSILLAVEKATVRRGRVPRGSLVAPLGLLLYSAMRLSIDPLRAESNSEGLGLSHSVILVTMPLEAFWLWRSWRLFKRDSQGIPGKSIQE